MLDEPISYLLWPRAALMQLAHPSIAPTEVESGAYGNRGAHRWRATIEYLRLVASDDDESVRLLIREVNRIHASVRQPVDHDVDGPRRPAFDSANQGWVAATWLHSLIDAYRLMISDIDDDVLDQLVVDFERVGGLLQMTLDEWPQDYAAFLRYIEAGERTFPARLPRSDSRDAPERLLPGDVAAQVFSTYSLPFRYVRMAPTVRLLTWGAAGPQVREIYGVEWSQEHQQLFDKRVRRWRRRMAWWPGVWRRRNGRKQRRRSAERLREHQTLAYTEVKAIERRRSRTKEDA